MNKRTFDWGGVEYQSPEYWRRYREANGAKLREYKRAYDSKRYETHAKTEVARRKRYIDKYPERVKANQKVAYELKRGNLTKKPCEVCFSVKSVAHHDDWSKPLDISWLCELHHKFRHKELHEKNDN